MLLKALTPILNMAEEVLQNVLEWCFKNTNILEAKDNDKYGESLIHFASERGYVSVVTQLLAKGVSPDLKDNSEFASLHLASRNGHTDYRNRKGTNSNWSRS